MRVRKIKTAIHGKNGHFERDYDKNGDVVERPCTREEKTPKREDTALLNKMDQIRKLVHKLLALLMCSLPCPLFVYTLLPY